MNCDVSKAEAVRNLEKQIATQDRAVKSAEQYVIDGGLHLANLRSRMVALRMAPNWGQVSDVATEWSAGDA